MVSRLSVGIYNGSMHKTGYTLIEIMASVMIMTVMMGIAIISFRGVTNTDRLKTDLVRVAGIIREARTRAFNGVIPKGATSYPTGGYGVYMNETTKQIVLFADNDDDNYYDTDEAIEMTYLNSKLTFKFIKKTPIITEQVVKFNGSSYPLVFDQSHCPPPADGELCLSNVTIPITPPASKNVLLQIYADATCKGQIKVSDKTSTIEPLLINTSLVNC